MWGRLSLQVRTSAQRIDDLRAEWKGMGGETIGLSW
jgi:hypothetical protein